MAKVLITGGAGFVGCNEAGRLMSEGLGVTVLDNLSRPGSAANLEWLRTQGDFTFVEGDIRDAVLLGDVLGARFDVVLHFAAQVAVTTSLADPMADFETNAAGTVRLLDAIRTSGSDPLVIYTSTNKVYGSLEDIPLREHPTRWAFRDTPAGIPETRPLDFHTPYACSKGAGDQYVRDYARVFGLRTVVLRQSAIYGPRQFGVADQGWVAWFVRAALLGRPVVIHGDGKQVRDLLYIEDLLDIYARVIERQDRAVGRIYNVGGGPSNTLSVLELVAMIEAKTGRRLNCTHGPARPGDQRVYVSDVGAATRDFGWCPRIGPEEGVGRLVARMESDPGGLA